jgi:type I restriction enzyme, R subunit
MPPDFQYSHFTKKRKTKIVSQTGNFGLTATPAKHTTEIFGKPVYTYSYREAVADDWLIDHEPPIRYETLLSKNGIRFEKGEKVSAINTATGEVELSEWDDELNFGIEAHQRALQ